MCHFLAPVRVLRLAYYGAVGVPFRSPFRAVYRAVYRTVYRNVYRTAMSLYKLLQRTYLYVCGSNWVHNCLLQQQQHGPLLHALLTSGTTRPALQRGLSNCKPTEISKPCSFVLAAPQYSRYDGWRTAY